MTAPRADLNFDELLKIANDKTADGRGGLFEHISDLLFDDTAAANDRERALMVDILQRLLHDVEMQLRKELSGRLSERKDAPHELLITLANDEIEVARPILMASDLLRDEELLEIIKHRTAEHQMAIAMRKSLSESISSALVEAGNEDVVTTLLQNPNAQISEATLGYLVEQSQRVDSYQNPLLSRADLKPDLAKKMYKWVSDTLKQKIVTEFKISPAEIEKTLEQSVETIFSQEDDNNMQKTVELVEAISKSRELTPGLLAKTLRDGEIPLFVAMFSKMTELDMPVAKKILFEGEGTVFALACKALGLDTNQFSDLYKLVRLTRSSGRDGRITEMSQLLSYFEQLKRTTAQNILRSWQREPQYLNALNKTSEKKPQQRIPNQPST